MCLGHTVADVVVILGSVDIVHGGSGSMIDEKLDVSLCSREGRRPQT